MTGVEEAKFSSINPSLSEGIKNLLILLLSISNGLRGV